MEQQAAPTFSLPRPRAVMIGLLATMFVGWAVMASLAKWGQDLRPFDLLVGKPEALFSEPWRIFTNPFVHDYRSLAHVATNLVFFYFMATPLEERWKKGRFLGSMLASAWIASFVELLLERYVPWFRTNSVVFGSIAMTNAACVAWAVQLRGAQVRLYGALPMSSTALLVLIVVMNVISVLAGGRFEGTTTPFVAMGLGFLLSDMSPLRRLYLQARYRRLAQQSARLHVEREGRAALRVIQGGASKKPDRSMMN
ncbi:MAG: rhomboid family intramembrane serine protease [Polyangiaceae bacterium]